MIVASDFGDDSRRTTHLVKASKAGLIVINKAIARFDGASPAAKRIGLSRKSVRKIMDGEGVRYSTFKQLCNGLGINNVEDVIDNELADSHSPTRSRGKCERKRLVFKIEIDIELFNEEYENALHITIDNSKMDIKKIEEGCVKLTLEGNSDDVDRIVLLVRSGELKELLGHPIQEAQALEIVGGEGIGEAEDKWALISSIRADTSKSIRRDLSKKDLSDANLQGVHLVGANLSNADLSCVDLSEAQLNRANLCNADLTEADLTGANLNDAKLQGANLRNAILDKSNLRHITIDRKTIIDDKWKQVVQILENPGRFKDCSGRDLSMAKLAAIDWRKANLRGADLREVDFTGADLRRANFNSATLSNANLADAELEGANFEAAEVRGAYFKDGRGLTDSEVENLLSRGAIFNRGSGSPERPPIWQPSPIRPTD